MKTKITVTCYGSKMTFASREAAEDYFWDCAENSEGSEQERYFAILSQLRHGKTVCHD